MDFFTAERVVALVDSVAGVWWAPFFVAFLYTPAALMLFFPRMLITLAAAVVFGPWKGLAIALCGVVASAALIYLAGRRMAPQKIERFAGPRFARISELLRKEGLLAVTTVGLLPIAPFAVVALVAGALRIRLHHFLIGVALAHLPGTLATSFLGDQVVAAVTQGREVNPVVIGSIVAGVAAMTLLVWRLGKRLKES